MKAYQLLRLMSSFIGHGLAAATVYAIKVPTRRSLLNLGWLVWLVILAWLPDIDYAVPSFRSSNHEGLRITHSCLVSLLLPSLTIVFLYTRQSLRKRQLLWLSMQAILSGLSHIVLDFWVGVMAYPLLWPLSNAIIKAPIGILPSSGALSLSNF